MPNHPSQSPTPDTEAVRAAIASRNQYDLADVFMALIGERKALPTIIIITLAHHVMNACASTSAVAAPSGVREVEGWQPINTSTWDMNRGEVLLWKQEWVAPGSDTPAGIRVGYFQEGDPGEECFLTAKYIWDQDCYDGECLDDPAEWPTHWRPHVPSPNAASPPAVAAAGADDTTDALRIVRHKKRGALYEVIGEARLQTTERLPDDAPVVIYRGVDDGKLWARSPLEFEDGRFEDATLAATETRGGTDG